MPRMSVYLYFTDQTEAAFTFYKSVFGTEYINEFTRYGDFPPAEGEEPLAPDVANLILNVELPIFGDQTLLGNDMPVALGGGMTVGSNVTPTLFMDSPEQAEALFTALSVGGEVRVPIADQYWGDYYGELVDQFGVQWFVLHRPKR